MERLILIPARGGSTRVPNKNLRNLCGKPLVEYAIEMARGVSGARVVVSTDSKEIAEVARSCGAEVPFLRPSNLATATSSSLSAILHAITVLGDSERRLPDQIAFCPPTNPLIQSQSVSKMFEILEAQPDFNSIVTISAPRTHPFQIVKKTEAGQVVNGTIEIDGKTINDIERSQDWPRVWEGSPACRITRTGYFRHMIGKEKDPLSFSGKTYDVERCLGYEISPDEACDINGEIDFIIAEAFLSRKLSAKY